jgi:hypothetical protein
MRSFIVEAMGNGRVVNWRELKKGKFVDQRSLSFSITTILTDAVVDMYNICREFDKDCKIVVIEPNGFTTSKFRIAFRGANYSVICERIKARGGFPLNPLAAEFGKNYNILFNINTQAEELQKKIYNHFKNKYVMEEII